eukprot:3253594-Karenia_brevis.AAC.1
MRDDDSDQLNRLRDISAAAALQVDCEAIAKTCASFSQGSGVGPSGLRLQHLEEALVPGFRDEVLRHLTEV